MFKKVIFTVMILLILTGVGFFVYLKFFTVRPISDTNLVRGNLVYGWNKWIGGLPYLVAYDKGYFTEEGLNVSLKAEESYGMMLQDIIAGSIDFSGGIALMDLLQNEDEGGGLQIVGITGFSKGADGIVADSSILSPAELKGKKVAVEKGTLGEKLLYAALERASLNLEDVQEIDLTAEQGAVAFVDGRVDAVVTYEPFLTDALVKKVDSHKIFSSADEPGLIVDTLVFRTTDINENPNQVRAVLRAYFRAIDFINNNPREAYVIGSKYFLLEPDDLEVRMRGLQLAGIRESIIAFSYAGGFSSLYTNARFSTRFLLRTGKLEKNVDLEKLINSRFVREIHDR